MSKQTIPANQSHLPIQPVERPILCSPYEEPGELWLYDAKTGEASPYTCAMPMVETFWKRE